MLDHKENIIVKFNKSKCIQKRLAKKRQNHERSDIQGQPDFESAVKL